MSSDPHLPDPYLADPYWQASGSVEPVTHAQSASPGLRDTLLSSFGFADFRANQEAVCQAALEGRDVLLVMPTGAGKSLCYQLPGIVRGGTTLVISPLIALMEDQSSKLSQLGFRAARIHSGMDRGNSRAVCVAYLKGELDFLFIAPERMKVPGFPQMLAKRKPSLIAVDEAHCISQWGHDFRPDYRVLGQHLEGLRPAPIIALTATATPVVQDDVVRQLRLQRAARFIHGFRRHNLAIEAVETPVPERVAKIVKLLSDDDHRPAIVYAPTRKKSEELAMVLGERFQAAAYHAGMESQDRESVQRDFLGGKLEVVVATTAFGMGIDKADVRTVIHAAMPGTLEGYYQEIGRAGRDGQPSRAILLYSFADRRTHDFFFERDYPSSELLTKVYSKCTAEPRSRDWLRKSLRMDAEEFDNALDRLEMLGACVIDPDGAVSLGDSARTDFSWRAPYQAQVSQRKSQIEAMQRFAESHACRMAALVKHFGDTADRSVFCGLCDVCSPERAVAQQFRELTSLEERGAAAVLRDLNSGMAKATGKLHRDVFPREELKRDDFEALLGAMVTMGWIAMEDATFEKEGRTLSYRRASLTRDGESVEPDDVGMLRIRDSAVDAPRKSKSTAAKSASPKASKSESKPKLLEVELSAEDAALEQKLRVWRSGEAKKYGFAAFCVFSDKTMRAIVLEKPASVEDLQQVDGIGPAKIARYGEEICRLCSETE